MPVGRQAPAAARAQDARTYEVPNPKTLKTVRLVGPTRLMRKGSRQALVRRAGQVQNDRAVISGGPWIILVLARSISFSGTLRFPTRRLTSIT